MKMNFYAALIAILGLSVTGWAHAASCSDTTPVTTVYSYGGGQSSSINNAMFVRFTGQITTTNGLTNRGKNTVKICKGTTVSYQVLSNSILLSSSGISCGNRSVTGTLMPGDSLVCSNKNNGGRDTDRFRVVAAR